MVKGRTNSQGETPAIVRGENLSLGGGGGSQGGGRRGHKGWLVVCGGERQQTLTLDLVAIDDPRHLKGGLSTILTEHLSGY